MAHEAGYRFIFKENMAIYLKALNDCIFRRYGNVSVDILVAGGSALIIGHNFRKSTEDIDTFVRSQVDIIPCINEVTNMFSIASDWMNSDFIKSPSFSSKLTMTADFVTSYGVLNLYKVSDLDLICMKLISYRIKDKDDLLGLLKDCNVTQGMIQERLVFLYGDDVFLKMKEEAIRFVRTHVRR